MIKSDIVKELHRPARKHFKRRKVIIKGLDDLWQADLVEMGTYASANKGYRFLLTVIDAFSKYAWAVPTKTKTGTEITQAMQTILNEGRQPINLQTDDGKEFYNKHFQNLLGQYNINHYSVYSNVHACIIERWNRTIKEMMWKEFSLKGSYRWLEMIKDLVKKYNNTRHRTIKMKPVDVNTSNEKQLLSAVFTEPKIYIKPKFNVGDSVRISKFKHVFEKGYTPNWSTEIFKIRKVQITNPVTYLIEDYQKNPIQGGFYEYELQAVKHPEAYLVEKVLRRSGNKVFVKWLGFDNTHNSWINKNKID